MGRGFVRDAIVGPHWTAPLRAVVAIPVKDEEERLGACLAALGRQVDREGHRLAWGTYGVVLLLNNCRDGSAAVARAWMDGFPAPLRVIERELPSNKAHAGMARRLAMDAAATWMEEAGSDGLILTTDADSRVSPHWIAQNLAAAAAGVDAVAGSIVLDEIEDLALPDLLHRRGRLEALYERQIVELAALLDPLAYNPWPHHATASGASLAVTLTAYRLIGGLPILPFGEDRALVAALRAHDARVRFSPDVRVVTSGRLNGRAPGGAADTMRQRSEDPEAPCDDLLEPARIAVRRAGWRGRLRRLHQDGRLHLTDDWTRRLALAPDEALAWTVPGRFGAFWARVEAASPMLARSRLTVRDLPAQIRRAGTALEILRSTHGLAGHRAVVDPAAARASGMGQPPSLDPVPPVAGAQRGDAVAVAG